MKTLAIIIIAIVLLFTNTINAQSLAEQTGETKSLYNAICIANNITPGDITMTEFRALAVEYAASIGLNYKLYLKNGGNNLEILHFTSSVATKAKPNKITIQPLADKDFTTVDTVQVHDTVKVFRIIADVQIIHDTIIENTITNDTIVSVSAHTCDCRGMNIEELNYYYTETVRARNKASKGKYKDQLGLCAYQIRKHKKDVERDSSDARIARVKATKRAKLGERIIGKSQNRITQIKKEGARKISKIRKTRKVRKPRGAKPTRGKSGRGFKLFPYANC